MRRIGLIILLALGLSYEGAAQRRATVRVPNAVERAFHQRYPGISNVYWEPGIKGDYKVNFTYSGIETQATFNRNGWVATHRTILPSQLPLTVQKALQTSFKGFDVYTVHEVHTAANGIKYEVELRDEVYGVRNLLLSNTGELIVNVIAEE